MALPLHALTWITSSEPSIFAMTKIPLLMLLNPFSDLFQTRRKQGNNCQQNMILPNLPMNRQTHKFSPPANYKVTHKLCSTINHPVRNYRGSAATTLLYLVFDLQDWISNLNEIEEEPILRFDSVDEKPQVVQNELNTDNTSILRRNLCDFISQYQIQKQHFFETNSPETESPFTNIYACTIAQTLLQPPAEKASAENSSKLGTLNEVLL